MKFKILIVGERGLKETVEQCLPKNERVILWQRSPEKAQETVAAEAPGLIVVDFGMPQSTPFKFLSECVDAQHPVVMVAANPLMGDVVKCLKLGARDFLQFPQENDRLQELLKNACAQWRQNQKGLAFQAQQPQRFDLSGIIGESQQMREVVERIKKIVGWRWVTVLICGETGVGKEIVARAIHHGSANTNSEQPAAREKSSSGGAFVEVNCTAIPENLLEAELFGYEKGAFTDAKFCKKGLFELADGGTLFLDEIGDMSLVLQAKLLKVIEEKRFRRLGGIVTIQVNTRIIAGTNANLEERISEGRFRRDLYYRLNVINIHLPPLRERGHDILLLARHFLARYRTEYASPAQRFSPDAEALLMSRNWPGNVRELQHVVERAVLLGENVWIGAKEIYEALGIESFTSAPVKPATNGGAVIEIPREGISLKQGECKLIEQILRLAKGNKTRASQILGISRPRLSRKLEEYQIEA